MQFAVGNPGGPGRPSRYSKTLAEAICWRIAEGELLIDIAADPAMPSRSTIYQWTEEPRFQDMWNRAKTIQAHAFAEKGLKLALSATAEDAHARRVQFDGYKWAASKVLPKVYGDKMLHTGADGEGPIAVKLTHDWSLLPLAKQAQLIALIEEVEALEAAAKQKQLAGPVIEGEAEESE